MERRRLPIFRCPEKFKKSAAHVSVRLIIKRLIEAQERKNDA